MAGRSGFARRRLDSERRILAWAALDATALDMAEGQ
jgi:hypothetical protein